MSEPIILEHIEWVNDMDPALCDQNLNKDQKALEACVEVANKFNGLKNANNEERYNYPNDKYLANSNVLKDITAALNSKGVESTGIFKNIPPEIRSIQTGGIAPTAVINECIKANLVGEYHIIEAGITGDYNSKHYTYVNDNLTGRRWDSVTDAGQPILPSTPGRIIPCVSAYGWGFNGIYISFTEEGDAERTLLGVWEISKDEKTLVSNINIGTNILIGIGAGSTMPIVEKKYLIIQGVEK